MRFLIVTLQIMLSWSLAVGMTLPEGSDLAFGGSGSGNGTFDVLRDFSFGPGGRIYALDGAKYGDETKAMVGNRLVQIFDSNGTFIRQFPITPPTKQPSLGNPRADHASVAGIYDDPQRIVVDGKGDVFLTQPAAGVVQIYTPKDELLAEIPLPHAMVIAHWRGKIAVLGSQDEALPQKGWTPMGGGQINIIDAAGKITSTIELSQHLTHVSDMATDRAGNFYFQADKNQLYKFSPEGKLLKTIGSGTSTRRNDGSELIHAAAVDSKGGIYGMTVGNPGNLTRFDATMASLQQRDGQFHWADSWSYPDQRTVVRVDDNDRIWVATTTHNKPNKYPSPAIMRLKKDFFAQAKVTDVRAMGLFATIQTPLVDSIAYDLQPIQATLVIAPASRNIKQAQVSWHAYDMYKTLAGQGSFNLSLEDGKESRQDFSFQPPAYGWYTVELTLSDGQHSLLTIGKHFGVTRLYPGMPAIKAGQASGSWEDPWRQAFVGHPLLRLHPAKGLDKLDADVTTAEQAGVFVFGQFTDKKDCTVENVEATVTRLKGRVKVWEIMNEPNFSMGPDDYASLVKKLYPVIKRIDPEAKVMGPDVCGIDLWYYETFYKAGGKDFIDILSIHDYEGHESIDPIHWRWKLGELHQLMAKYGDSDKPIWQTERAIGGVRGGLFQGATQAVRTMLQQDLDTVLGVPEGRNWLYYLNEGGYSSVPSYLWSKAGPHPAAMALRTRHAMIADRNYSGEIDFGATGNKLMLGLNFHGNDGSTVILRNLGLDELPLSIEVHGGNSITIVDAFGNEQKLSLENGKAVIPVHQMPIYLRLEPDQEFVAGRLDLGDDLASEATFKYSAPSTNLDRLNNGIWETYQHGGANGGPDGKALFKGEIPKGVTPSLELNFPSVRKVSAVLIAGMRADNLFSTLLDYDLQYRKNGSWVTIKEVRTPLPQTSSATFTDCVANTWYQDNNLFLNTFDPVSTTGLRLVIRRTTYGYVPDDLANDAVRKSGGGDGMPTALWLREVEVYGNK